MDWHLAQVNIGRLRAPVDDPLISEFKAALAPINAVADRTPGFVWRLQTAEGDATAIRPVADDELIAINMSVWESVEALADFVYRSDHIAFLRRRREWFQQYGGVYAAMWWIPAGELPTIDGALQRLDLLDAHGPTPEAFTFAKRFPPPTDLGVDRLDNETVDTQMGA